MVSDRRLPSPQLSPGDAGWEEAGLVVGSEVKPEGPLADAIEEIAQLLWNTKRLERYFTFVFENTNWDRRPATGDTLKSEITHSRRLHPREWKDAAAVVLSHRGKRNLRLDVVFKLTDQAFKLDVDLKTGKMKWQQLNTKSATQLKEALSVAQR